MASNVIRSTALKFIDPVFRGCYHGSKKHEDDFKDVLQRAADIGMEKIMITGGNLKDSRKALELAKTEDQLYSTVGCHPTRCSEFEANGNPDKYLADLIELATSSHKVVALGECGLDYDRTQFCPPDVQRKYFERQMEAAEATKLPLFLHCRNSAPDFMEIISRNRDKISGGVELKKRQQLQLIRASTLASTDDAPWCEVKATHAGHKHVKTTFPSKKKERWEQGSCVKGRNEPAHIIQVLEVMAAARGEDIEQLASIMYDNTMKLFFNKS